VTYILDYFKKTLTFIFALLHHWLPDALAHVHEPVGDLLAVEACLLHEF
jgi:hypothetical protein